MRKQRAFTLVELLVVIGVIALLIAMLIPMFSKAREKALRIKCAANLRGIGQGLLMYFIDHKEYPRGTYVPGDLLNVGGDAPIPRSPPGDKTGNDCTVPLFRLFKLRYISMLDVFLCPSASPVEKSWVTSHYPTDPESIRRHAYNFHWAEPLPSVLSYSYANPYPPTYMSGGDTGGGGGGGPVIFQASQPQVPYPVPLSNRYKGPPHVAADFALAADLNNGDGGSLSRVAPPPGMPASMVRRGNSSNHNHAGQNVLFFDGHVSWCETIFCGHAGDNIYNGQDGLPGTDGYRWPITRNDSVLLPG